MGKLNRGGKKKILMFPGGKRRKIDFMAVAPLLKNLDRTGYTDVLSHIL